ncbi:MAG: tripartite tricarboxylate transporter TctB family protein [Pseudomonadota bacterium]
MLTQRLANIIFTLLVIAACVWFAIIAEGFEASGLLASSGLPSKFFPQLLLAVTALCAVIVAVLYVFKGETGGDAGETVFADFAHARRGLLMMAVAIACYVIWKQFGFIPMAVVIGPLSLLAMGVTSISHYVIVWLLTGFVYLVFTSLLNVQFT